MPRSLARSVTGTPRSCDAIWQDRLRASTLGASRLFEITSFLPITMAKSLRDKMKPERCGTAGEKAKTIMDWIEDRKLQERIFGEAAREAIASAHAAGLYTTHGNDKDVFRLYPDGHREYITEEEREEVLKAACRQESQGWEGGP